MPRLLLPLVRVRGRLRGQLVRLAAQRRRAAGRAGLHAQRPPLLSPPSPEPYAGDGSFITFQVADARAEYERLVADEIEIALALTDEPWGQRRFGVVDPAGMWVDVVEQIEPASGWWDPYLELGDGPG